MALTIGHSALIGKGIYMLLLLALLILFAEKMGEQSGGKISRKTTLRVFIAGAAVALAANGVLIFNTAHALWVLRFDLLFFSLVPPFCFGLWEKSAR